MDERGKISWLHRRAGFGLHPKQLDSAVARGLDAELTRLLSPTEAGVAAAPALFDDSRLTIDVDASGAIRTAGEYLIRAWFQRMASTNRPLEDRLAWMLHGWLVSALDKVRRPRLMADQIRLFLAQGGGSYPDLLRAITVDGAMLRYLDGRQSTADRPNENYGRELMELFSLGPDVNAYTEADVKAAAAALTGWVVRNATDAVEFVPRRHDDTAQHFLGRDGVGDVDAVIAAIVEQPAHPTFVARRIALEYLGAADPDDVGELATAYESGGRSLLPMIRRALELGLDGHGAPIVLAPVPWLAATLRLTKAEPPRLDVLVRATGQIPMYPPDVSGWPRGEAWLATGTLVARTRIAAAVATATSADQPVAVAAQGDDLDALAVALGIPDAHFSAATADALQGIVDPVERLAVAFVSPEFLLT